MRRSGKDVAIVGYGSSVLECLAAAEILAKVRSQNIAADFLHAVITFRT